MTRYFGNKRRSSSDIDSGKKTRKRSSSNEKIEEPSVSGIDINKKTEISPKAMDYASKVMPTASKFMNKADAEKLPHRNLGRIKTIFMDTCTKDNREDKIKPDEDNDYDENGDEKIEPSATDIGDLDKFIFKSRNVEPGAIVTPLVDKSVMALSA